MTKKQKLDTIIHILDVAMAEKNKVKWVAYKKLNGEQIIDEINGKLNCTKNLLKVSDSVVERIVESKDSITGVIFNFTKKFKNDFLKKIQDEQTDPRYKFCLALKTNKK
jgi:hypothetical protein